MEIKTIITVIIAGMLGAVVFAGILPVFADVTQTEDTFTNDGLWRMKELDNGDTYSLSTGSWSYNGDVILSGSIVSSNQNSSVVLGDNWTVRSSGGVRGSDIAGNSTNTVVVGDDDEITITGTGITGTTTQSLTGYGADLDGAYIMTAYNTTVYMNGDSPLYATGVSYKDDESIVIHISGTIDDGFTVTPAGMYWPGNPAYSNFNVSNLEVNYTPVSGYEDLYKLSGITMDVSYDMTKDEVTTSGSMSVSYSSYVVPYEITADRSHPVDGPAGALFNLLPVIIVIGLVIGIAGVVLVRRI